MPDPATLAAMSEAERKRQLLLPAGGPRAPPSWSPGRSRISSWRSCIFAAIFMRLRQADRRCRGSMRSSPTARRGGRLPARRSRHCHRRPADRKLRRHAAHRRASAGEHPLTIVVDRDGVHGHPEGDARAHEVKDSFGNVHRIGMLGISRAMRRRRSKCNRSPRSTPSRLGVEEDLVRRRADAELHRRRCRRPRVGRPARRPDPHRADVRTGGDAGLRRADSLGRGAFGLDRAAQSVPDSAARWRSPSVLR